jgi:DNA-directed RNA polymerase specialized sigma24 family protein
VDDLQLAAELRSRSPDALPDLLDAYGNRIFGYCWCLLRNRENAQAAVRDVLIIAAGQAGRLARDEWLGPWLYYLARGECGRRGAFPASDADESLGEQDQHHADRRLMAWHAVASMDADEVEALELACRHDVDLSLVLGLPPAEVAALLDRARQNLELAVAAQVLISNPHACPDQAEVMDGWPGIVTPPVRDRVLEHADTCLACGPRRPRNVSAARVFGLLPAPELPSSARLEMLEFIDDPRMWAYREFVIDRAAELTGSVFLTKPDTSRLAMATQRPVSRAGVSRAGVACGPAISGPCVAQGFIGSWEHAGPGSASATEPPAASSPPGIPPARWARPVQQVPSAGKSPPGWRRRISRLGVAAAVGVMISAAVALMGLRLTPAPTRAVSPATASTSRPGDLATPRDPGAAGQATDTGPGAGLSWTGDRSTPLPYRPGPAGPPDRPRAGRDVSGRAHGAEL